MKIRFTLFLVSWMFFFTASPGAEGNLRYVRGAFLFDNVGGYSLDLDQSRIKLKYPYIADEHLVFLSENRESAPHLRFHAYRIRDILELGKERVVHGKLVYPGEKDAQRHGFGQKIYPGIRAFLPNLVFLEANMDGRSLARKILTRKHVLPDELNSIHYYLAINNTQAWSTENGLFYNGRNIFPTKRGAVYSFDISNGMAAISHDERDSSHGERDSEVCLKKLHVDTPCHRTSDAPGETEPLFSESGAFLATAIKDKQGSRINIHAIDRTRTPATGARPILVVEDIEFSHHAMDGFIYFGSYKWVGDSLYFIRMIKTGGSDAVKKTVFKVECRGRGRGSEARCSEPAALFPPRCIATPFVLKENKKPSPGPTKREAEPSPGEWRDFTWAPPADGSCREMDKHHVNIKIQRLVWAQPFKYDNEIYIAAQAVVRTEFLRIKSGHWLDRILIFKEEPWGTSPLNQKLSGLEK